MRKSLPPVRFFGGVLLGAAHVATALDVPPRRSGMPEIVSRIRSDRAVGCPRES
jgi:hypothetical protein